MTSDEQLRDLEERYEGYTVYDRDGEKIGKVDDLFVDETDREEYIGVKMGLFGLSGTTLIPMDVVRVDERERAMEVSESKEHVKDAPNFSDDDDITPEYEDRIRRHFGLGSLESSTERGSYGRGAAGDREVEDRERMGGGTGVGDRDRVGGGTDVEERVGQESYRNRESMGDESAMGSAGAGTATPSGGARDLETSDRGGAEDEGFREGYREGFREGYQEALQEGGEPGGRGDISPSASTTGAGSVGAAGERDLGEREGIRSSGATEGEAGRDRDLVRGDREQGREGAGERREESTSTKVWRRIRG